MKKLQVSVLALVGIFAGSQAQPIQAVDTGAVDRYKSQPIKRLVDAYVLDVIGALPSSAEATLERIAAARLKH